LNQKNFKLVFTLYFIVFGLVIALFGSLVGYKLQLINIKDRIDKSAEEVSFIKKNNTLKPDIDKLNTLLLALSTDKILHEYLISPNQKNKTFAQDIFYTVSMSDSNIMQARFIDASGKEQIRIDRSNASSLPFVVTNSDLQNKSGREYFQIVSKMKSDTFWYSKIDLNIEHDKIEVPYRPTYRVATPIYINKKFKGIVIINVLMNDILAKISKSTVFDHYIIDKEGNYIIHPDERLSCSKYTGSNAKLIDDFPSEASKILSGASKGETFYAYTLDEIFNNDDDVRLILKPKAAYINELFNSNIKTSILVIIISIFLSVPLAIYASIAPSKLQKALLISNSELKRFADIIDKYVVTATTKTNSIITAVSSAYEKLSGYSKEELIGQKINIINHPDTPKKVYKELWSAIEKGNEWKGELQNKDKNGDSYWVEQNIISIKDENNNISSYMSVEVDITAKKELEIISTIDRLTNIANRRKLDEYLSLEAETAQRYDRPLSLFMIDIDHFKKVNDTYGHQIGDYALQSVAKLLKDNIRNTDIVGRFGGEEFMVICPETDQHAASVLAEKLRLEINNYHFETINHITISIGVAQIQNTNTISEWIERADKALYRAKGEGRNQVAVEG